MKKNPTPVPRAANDKPFTYSGMALAFIGIGVNADAQVVYTDVDPDIVLAGSIYPVDFNGDGIAEVTIRHDLGGYDAAFLTLGPAASMIGTAYYDNDSHLNVRPTRIGNNVAITPANPNWQTFGFGLLAFEGSYGGAGLFRGQTGFLGMHFSTGNGNVHYGWVELSAAGNSSTCTVKSYAYEATPNTLIMTLQTPVPTDCEGVVGGPAVAGTPCDDGDGTTTNDVYDANCLCAGEGCDETSTLTFVVDGELGTSWNVTDTDGNVILSGVAYSAVAGIEREMDLCLDKGCYQLNVFDADGIDHGGYTLRDRKGRRVIVGTGEFAGTSSVPGTTDFCLPLSGVALENTSCNKNLTLDDNIEVEPVPGATDYQFWIFDPHGSYSRKVVRQTNTLDLNYLNSEIPLDLKLNVRVRAMANGNATRYGKACTLRVTDGGREVRSENIGTTVSRFLLFPNPNGSDALQLTIEGLEGTDAIAQVEIRDALGRLVRSEQVNVASGTLNHMMQLGSDMHAGLYIVQVNVGGKVFTERLVRQ